MNIELLKGDCLIESDKIENGSVDLILTDLPYGTIKNLWDNTSWDDVIDTDKIFEIANRILRKNGKMILFAQQPFTTELITKAIPNIPFCYNMIWEKDSFGNCLAAKKAAVNYYEDVLVFSKQNPIYDEEFTHPLRPYFKKVFEFIGKTKKAIVQKVGQKADHTFRFNSSQFSLCTEETYNEIIRVFSIDKMQGFKPFLELQEIDLPYKSNLNTELNLINPSTFNLWEGGKSKSNILKYKKDYQGHHPTQKPVLLLEDIIKTFSNENDLVIDLTMGSGSCGVACKNTNRRFTGIEMDSDFFNIAKTRINA